MTRTFANEQKENRDPRSNPQNETPDAEIISFCDRFRRFWLTAIELTADMQKFPTAIASIQNTYGLAPISTIVHLANNLTKLTEPTPTRHASISEVSPPSPTTTQSTKPTLTNEKVLNKNAPAHSRPEDTPIAMSHILQSQETSKYHFEIFAEEIMNLATNSEGHKSSFHMVNHDTAISPPAQTKIRIAISRKYGHNCLLEAIVSNLTTKTPHGGKIVTSAAPLHDRSSAADRLREQIARFVDRNAEDLVNLYYAHDTIVSSPITRDGSINPAAILQVRERSKAITKSNSTKSEDKMLTLAEAAIAAHLLDTTIVCFVFFSHPGTNTTIQTYTFGRKRAQDKDEYRPIIIILKDKHFMPYIDRSNNGNKTGEIRGWNLRDARIKSETSTVGRTTAHYYTSNHRMIQEPAMALITDGEYSWSPLEVGTGIPRPNAPDQDDSCATNAPTANLHEVPPAPTAIPLPPSPSPDNNETTRENPADTVFSWASESEEEDHQTTQPSDSTKHITTANETSEETSSQHLDNEDRTVMSTDSTTRPTETSSQTAPPKVAIIVSPTTAAKPASSTSTKNVAFSLSPKSRPFAPGNATHRSASKTGSTLNTTLLSGRHSTRPGNYARI